MEWQKQLLEDCRFEVDECNGGGLSTEETIEEGMMAIVYTRLCRICCNTGEIDSLCRKSSTEVAWRVNNVSRLDECSVAVSWRLRLGKTWLPNGRGANLEGIYGVRSSV